MRIVSLIYKFGKIPTNTCFCRNKGKLIVSHRICFRRICAECTLLQYGHVTCAIVPHMLRATLRRFLMLSLCVFLAFLKTAVFINLVKCISCVMVYIVSVFHYRNHFGFTTHLSWKALPTDG